MVIDLHCHLLPGIDDGPPDLPTSLRMALVAVEEGIHTIVATPHVNLEYDNGGPAIATRIADVRAALDQQGISLSVVSGAEVGLARLAGLDDGQLSALCIGRSSYVLVESPYASPGALMEESMFDLQVRGFRPVLAHPERCPDFQRDVSRLRELVDGGVACSVNAGSLVGNFGQTARRFSHRLLELGLVHNVSSDAHDPVRRRPALAVAFKDPSGVASPAALRRWLTESVPAAILADEPLPPRPSTPSVSRWRRLIERL